jgi:23S rRNA (guanosine2251-2'-O)-methyltransferase
MSRVVYGLRPVEEALRARRVHALFVIEGQEDETRGPLRGLLEAAKQFAVTPVPRAKAALDALAKGGVHQGVVAITGEYPYASVEQILASPAGARETRPPLVLVLDGLQDPQNFGALVRTAHVVGVDGIIIPRDRQVAVTPAVVKASAGATEHARIALVTNVARTLEELKQAGLWICGAVAQEGEPPWKIDMKVPLALVLGAEGRGIRPLVLRGCDLFVRIPMIGQVASLNVGAAGAMLLYEAARQRS